jgi:DnaJ-class molecular chaperone
MRISERYASAVHSTSLQQSDVTIGADVDVIGAFGFASKYEPIGVALARFLSGGGAAGVIESMAYAAMDRSYRHKPRITELHALELATAVLSWYRYGTCQPCGGTGYKRIEGTPVNGDECNHCAGTGKIPFDRQFSAEMLPLAQWLSSEIDRSQAAAGYAAMVALAPKLDL